MGLKTVFWFSAGIILYAYLGYTLLLAIVAFFQRKGTIGNDVTGAFEPAVTLLIPAYNEDDSIEAKMKNSLELDYPKEKLNIVWVTDGSDDDSAVMLSRYKNITVYHEPARRGKIHAMNR